MRYPRELKSFLKEDTYQTSVAADESAMSEERTVAAARGLIYFSRIIPVWAPCHGSQAQTIRRTILSKLLIRIYVIHMKLLFICFPYVSWECVDSSPWDKMAAILQTTFSLVFREWKLLYFDWNFTEI